MGAPMTAATEQQVVTSDEIRTELTRILASPDFAASHQLASFLQYIVAESLAGRGDRLKERTVARGALGRDASFDPRLDCVVRVVAGKLRRALERFYSQQGAADPLWIDVPKGSYSPLFHRRAMQPTVSHSEPGGDASGVKPTTSNGNGRPVVAVMPLRSFTGGSHERFLADLLADDVALRLSRLHWLNVIDYLAAGSPEAELEEPCAIAARLHADFVFAGTVSKVGRRVRLTVRLIDVHTGILAWVDQFDRCIDKGPLAQQDDIADRIAAGLCRFFGAGTYAAGA